MCVEGQFIEYKDFHKDPKLNEKSMLAKLFREISAFANASGGQIIVGKEDKTGIENEQPVNVYKCLDNDRLTSSINKMSDNLIVFSAHRKGNLIVIKIKESDDVISAISDAKGINKGDCFIRENHESVKIQGEKLKKLIEKKLLSEDKKTKALRKIVHYKMNNNMNHANQMNIFDSMFVLLESPYKYINVVFDALVKNEFLGAYRLPLSKYSTMQVSLDVFDSKLTYQHQLVKNNNDAFNKIMESVHTRESFFKAQRDEVLCSPQLKVYILEYKGVIEGL